MIDVRMKSAIEERYSVIVKVGRRRVVGKSQFSGWIPGLGKGAMQFNNLWKRNVSTE